MESLAGAARTLGLIMNGWYSASQEIVFSPPLECGALAPLWCQSADKPAHSRERPLDGNGQGR